MVFFQSSMKFLVFMYLSERNSLSNQAYLRLLLEKYLEVRSILSEDAKNMFSIAFTVIIQNIFSILQWLDLSEEYR